MMKRRIYTCLLMLVMLSTAAFAQKKGTPEYNAQLRATIVAMDSVLKYSTKIPPEILMKFADEQCAKFKNDPEVMDLIAEAFYLHYIEVFGGRRYDALKKMHPEYTQVYITEARLLHAKSWYEDAEGLHFNEELMRAAKSKIDSAKIMMPQSEDPYMVWIKRQAPYRAVKLPSDLTLDHELEELHKKFPAYQCYLEVARYYGETLLKKKGLSQDDMTNYLVYSAEFYDKAGTNGEMTAQYWQNYAWLHYAYNLDEDQTVGVKVAERGLKQYPNYPGLLRMKMWNEGKAKKWNDVFETSKLFFQYADTLKPSYVDYMWLAQAYKNTENYTEAINFLDKELELVKDTTKRLDAILDKVRCYNYMKPSQFDASIKTFADYEQLKRSLNRKMDYIDYQHLVTAYEGQAKDSTFSKEERVKFYLKADSVCQLSVDSSPEYAVMLNYRRFRYFLFDRYRIEYGIMGHDQVVFPEFLEAATRLTQSVIDKKTPLEDLDYFYLMEGYYWTLIHYVDTKNSAKQFEVAEKMVSVDMPSAMELTTLSSGAKKEYEDFVDKAQDIYKDLYKLYGKKRK
ncbi:MAG: hypothetical protein J6I52_10080 [Prevotella sp.]|nr:hypothetical protein [Prevotella sp.]